MVTSSSYLQTLSQDEARSFVASLQKVKGHLSEELAWMSQQVQQKTVQLQGIETLLSEAVALGLISDEAEQPIAEPIESEPTTALQETPNSPPENIASNPPQSANVGSNRKSEAASSKPASRSTQSASKGGARKELRDLLVPALKGTALTDAVAQILHRSGKPLHLDELLAEMYGKLSDADFKRAKVSLANVLSVGKNEGKWRSLGQGRYGANTVN